MEMTLLKFLFLAVLSVTCYGLGCHSSQIDLAGEFMALHHFKYSAGVDSSGEMWNTEMDFDEMIVDFDEMIVDHAIEGGLPGQPPVKFNQYAGYITVDKSNDRRLFYYFAEAVHDPSTKPLILWLNGGPSCSSLGMGAMSEIGPFGVNPDGKTLYSRRFAWNQVANVLFLESPAGVGFSYSNIPSDYDLSGDKRTAQDSYIFLVRWFERYPQYKGKDFYVIGESYAGYYIPELADLIIKKKMKGNSTTLMNLKGIMIGNGLIDDEADRKGLFHYIWSHALVSDETYAELSNQCNGVNSQSCKALVERVRREIGSLDFFNINGPICVPGERSPLGGVDPCEGIYVSSYLNLPQVQEALNANITRLPYPWQMCSTLIDEWRDRPVTMIPIYRSLMGSGLRILLYSGDMDAVVPVTSTRFSLKKMKLKVIKPWHMWTENNNAKVVAGYKVVYDGLTFATVRDAGHQVSRSQPGKLFTLLNIFLANI